MVASLNTTAQATATIPERVALVAMVLLLPLPYVTSGFDAWLVMVSGPVLVSAVFSLTPAWTSVAGHCDRFLRSCYPTLVMVATFAAAGALVTLTLVAALATPDRGPAAVGGAAWLDYVGTPIARATYRATAAVVAVALTIAAVACPPRYGRLSRTLSTVAVWCYPVLLVEFAALVHLLPVLSIEGFFLPTGQP